MTILHVIPMITPMITRVHMTILQAPMITGQAPMITGQAPMITRVHMTILHVIPMITPMITGQAPMITGQAPMIRRRRRSRRRAPPTPMITRVQMTIHLRALTIIRLLSWRQLPCQHPVHAHGADHVENLTKISQR